VAVWPLRTLVISELTPNDPLCSDLGESQISSWNPCPEASEDWLTWQLD
jgi:hypothetical protein